MRFSGVLGGLIGAAAALTIFGIRPLDPGYLGWLLWDDRGMSLAGWLFFQADSWKLPLGAADRLLVPIGGSIAVNDSIPLAALIGKLVLPPATQYFGIWLFTSYVILGVMAAVILRRVGVAGWAALAGAVLIVTNPVLASRSNHLTLMAQWTVLAGIWLVLAACQRPVGRALALNALTAFVHPYLFAMSFAMTLAAALASRSWQFASVAIGGALLAFGLAAVLLGYLGRVSDDVYGYGDFSADLLALINPLDRSAWLPELPAGPGQYEGFSYLGIAGLVLAVVAVAGWLRRPARLPWALIVAVVVLAIIALSARVTLLGVPILDATPLIERFGVITGAFRATGRFIWPLYYLILIGAIAGVARLRWGAVLIGLACLVQIAEFQPVYRAASDSTRDRTDLIDPLWRLVAAPYRQLVLLPPDIHPWACSPEDTDAYEVSRFLLLAGTQGLSINSGNLTRMDRQAAVDACAAGERILAEGRVDRDAVYILRGGTLAAFEARAPVRCGFLDGYAVCVAADRPSALRDAFGD